MEAFKQKIYWLLGLCLLLFMLYCVREALIVLFIAFIFASALFPWVDRLDRFLPRWLSVLIPYVLLTVIGVGIVLPVSAIVIQQLQKLIANIPYYFDSMMGWLGKWSFLSRRYPVLTQFDPALTVRHWLSLENSMFFSGFTGLTMAISQVGLDLISAFIISIFALLDREKIQCYFLRFRPVEEHEQLHALIEHLIGSTGAYVSGQLMFMISFGALISIGLYAIGLPFALLLGALAGLLTIIPIIGPNLVLAPALIIALLMPGGWVTALWVFLLFVAVQVLENNFVGPWMMGRAVGLHPLAIILAILAGGFLWGWVGIALAIPVATCANIILEEWMWRPRAQNLSGARPEAG